MAYSSAKAGEHPYKIIQKEIKNDQLKNVLFFYGRETYLVQWALSQIIDKYVNPACRELDLSRISGETVSFSEIQNCCETLPMMSPYKVVVVSDFKALSGARVKGFTEEEEKKLSAYLETVPSNCLLIFTGDAPDKRKKLFKAIASCGSAYDFRELDERLLKGFIEKRIRAAGKTVRPSVINTLVSESGYYDKETDYTLFHLVNDIDKAVAHSVGEEILLEDVNGTVSGNVDTNVFAMIDALSRGRKDEAFQLLHNLLFYGEKEYRLLSLICSQFESILVAKEMKEDGRSFDQIKTQLNIHEFRVKKAVQFAERYSLPHLRAVLRKAYEVDGQIKTGLLSASLALELLIAQI